jgi:hypothetical protein
MLNSSYSLKLLMSATEHTVINGHKDCHGCGPPQQNHFTPGEGISFP